MWKRYAGSLSLGVVIVLVAAACSTPTIDASAEQPTGGASASSLSETDGQMVHAGTDGVVDVELSDFAIDAGAREFATGESIEFRVVNTGVAPHEFRLSNQARVDEHVGAGHGGHEEGATPEDMANMEGMNEDDAEGADHAEAPEAEAGDHAEAPEAEDVILFLEPGESGTMVFHFPENGDDYTVAVCLVPGHYEAGMATDLSFSA